MPPPAWQINSLDPRPVDRFKRFIDLADVKESGQHRDWWNDWPGVDDKETPRAVIANAGVSTKKGSFRLYKCRRENPRPAVEIVSLDFISAMTGCAPFLVALTVE